MKTKLYFCKTFSLRSLIIVDCALFIVSRQARTIVKEQPGEKMSCIKQTHSWEYDLLPPGCCSLQLEGVVPYCQRLRIESFQVTKLLLI